MRALLPLLLLAACAPPEVDGLDGVRVEQAWLEGVELGGFGLIAGGFSGTADLMITSRGGDEYQLPVSLGGGATGFLIDLGVSLPGRVELSLPRTPVTGQDLFGTYRGSKEALVVLFGASGLHLENEAGVRIDDNAFAVGLSVQVATAWLNLSPDLPEPTPTGVTGDTGGPDDSAPTDTALPDTGGTGASP